MLLISRSHPIPHRKTFRLFSSLGRTQIQSKMKTFLIILATLMLSQFLRDEFGPRNPVARISEASVGSVRWLLQRALHVVE